MAKLFPANASATMVQEGEGHCSVSVPTVCMAVAIQTYLATGKAPPKDKRYCSRVEAPFLGTLSENLKRSEAVETMRKIGQNFHRTRGFPLMKLGELPLAPFSWAARFNSGSIPHGDW